MKQSKLQILTILVAFLVLAANAWAVQNKCPKVPEVSSTALLLGVTILGFGVVRRFLRR